MEDRLIWRKQDIALRRAPFILSDEMKQCAEQVLSRAADAVMNGGEGGGRQKVVPE
jgi:hypothetical protein